MATDLYMRLHALQSLTNPGPLVKVSPTAPDDSNLWADSSAGSPAARPLYLNYNGTWTAFGDYDETAGRLILRAPELNDRYVTASLASVSAPEENDHAFVTAASPWTGHVFLNGAWAATGETFDPASGTYTPGGTAPAAPVPEEWNVVTVLPALPGEEDVVWLLTGTAPNRLWQEHVKLGGGWVQTNRSYDEATGAFDSGAPAAPPPAAAATPGIMVLRHREPNGSDGGSVPHGGWRDRKLNDVQHDSLSGASLLGTGEVEIICPSARTFEITAKAGIGFYFETGLRPTHHVLRIADAGNTGLVQGLNHFATNEDGNPQEGATDMAGLHGVITLATGTHRIRLQHAISYNPNNFNGKLGVSNRAGFNAAGHSGIALEDEFYAHMIVKEIV